MIEQPVILECRGLWKLYGPKANDFLVEHGGHASSEDVKRANLVSAVKNVDASIRRGDWLNQANIEILQAIRENPQLSQTPPFGCVGSIHSTVSGASAGAISRLTATASPSLRHSTHSSGSVALALIS